MVLVGKMRMDIRLKSMTAFFAVLCLLSGCNDPDPEKPDRDQTPVAKSGTLTDDSFYKAVPSVLSPVALNQMISNPESFTLLDIRPKEEYLAGHIPGAIQIWRSDIEDSTKAFFSTVANRNQLESLLSRKCVLPGKRIVAYDDKGNVNAARMWWILRMYGHEKVFLLNGGLQGWKASGFELDTKLPDCVNPQTFNFSGAEKPEMLTTIQTIAGNLKSDSIIFLDVRSRREYTGEEIKERSSRPGHIQGAIWMEYSKAIQAGQGEDFTFKPVEELRKLYSDAGIDGSKPVITYCYSGYRSSLSLFVLQEILGYKQCSNYAASWIEWSRVDSLPADFILP